jgi:WD40 repeat protein
MRSAIVRKGVAMRIAIAPRRRAVSVIASSLVVLLVSGTGLTRASGEPAAGEPLWVSTYTGPVNGADIANAMVMSPDGSAVFVTGISEGEELDYATVAYDATTGNGLWAARYDSAHRDDTAYAIAVSPDGSAVFVTGASYGSMTGDDYATIAYRADTGKPLWVSRYRGSGGSNDAAYAIGVSPDGSTVFVSGASGRRGTSNQDYATVAYDATTGEQVWAARYGGLTLNDVVYALDVSPDGSKVFVTGQSRYDIATIAYDAVTGAGLWLDRFDGPADDVDAAYGLAVSPDGSAVFAAGYTGPDYVTIRYDAATGHRRWISSFNGPADQIDGASAVGVSPDGSRVFVTGVSTQLEGSLDADFVTLAYDAATGDQLWQAQYSGPGHHDDDPFALAITRDGSTVFAAGWITARGADYNYDYAAVAYDAVTGTQLGVARYDSGDDDLGYDAVVSPDGSQLLMTGRVGLGGDYGTIAFSLTS